ncbi:MAG: bile acid:sodium symporter, partial [Planctomycetes bacterium]|nr:bile acid:sodium symporter [Planctomycetota bacterium]
MHETLKRRWFLLVLTATLVAGITWAPKLASFAESIPRDAIIAAVLLAMALPLRIDTMWATLRRPGPALLAVAINLVLVPLLAYAASQLLVDDELAIGMIIAAAVPCTLASAAVWTRLAGGNDAVSLLVTMITNLSCFLVTPAWVRFLVGRGDASVPFDDMVVKLFVLVVLPIVAAQLLRLIPAVGHWAAANKSGLSVFAQFGILSIVFVGAVRCGQKLVELDARLATIWGQVALMLVLVTVVHVAAWWFGYSMAAKLGMARA